MPFVPSRSAPGLVNLSVGMVPRASLVIWSVLFIEKPRSTIPCCVAFTVSRLRMPLHRAFAPTVSHGFEGADRGSTGFFLRR